MVKRLEAKGLVNRVRAAHDERRLVLTVTEAGRQLQHEARIIPETMLCQVGLSAEEERQLRAMCEQIRRTLADDAPGAVLETKVEQ
ncbi:hypothetical protein AB0L14_37125 [Streptomyces sp. NPDC052727]|uniref:MarR family winged helix-turn-helix transcriptional regulator n=1 Tax=Streptomyces sp. NPDC052727 TaxID=3154854 RepID=UPI0034361DFA